MTDWSFNIEKFFPINLNETKILRTMIMGYIIYLKRNR